jgi:hypothetical protein
MKDDFVWILRYESTVEVLDAWIIDYLKQEYEVE